MSAHPHRDVRRRLIIAAATVLALSGAGLPIPAAAESPPVTPLSASKAQLLTPTEGQRIEGNPQTYVVYVGVTGNPEVTSANLTVDLWIEKPSGKDARGRPTSPWTLVALLSLRPSTEHRSAGWLREFAADIHPSQLPLGHYSIRVVPDWGPNLASRTSFVIGVPQALVDAVHQRARAAGFRSDTFTSGGFGGQIEMVTFAETEDIIVQLGRRFVDPVTGRPLFAPQGVLPGGWPPESAPYADQVASIEKVLDTMKWRRVEPGQHPRLARVARTTYEPLDERTFEQDWIAAARQVFDASALERPQPVTPDVFRRCGLGVPSGFTAIHRNIGTPGHPNLAELTGARTREYFFFALPQPREPNPGQISPGPAFPVDAVTVLASAGQEAGSPVPAEFTIRYLTRPEDLQWQVASSEWDAPATSLGTSTANSAFALPPEKVVPELGPSVSPFIPAVVVGVKVADQPPDHDLFQRRTSLCAWERGVVGDVALIYRQRFETTCLVAPSTRATFAAARRFESPSDKGPTCRPIAITGIRVNQGVDAPDITGNGVSDLIYKRPTLIQVRVDISGAAQLPADRPVEFDVKFKDAAIPIPKNPTLGELRAKPVLDVFYQPTVAGRADIVARIDPDNKLQLPGSGMGFKLPVEVKQTTALTVAYVKVDCKGAIPHYTDTVNNGGSYLRAQFPVSTNFSNEGLDHSIRCRGDRSKDADEVWLLGKDRTRGRANRVVGITESNWMTQFGSPEKNARGVTQCGQPWAFVVDGNWDTVAHEIGHTYQLNHPGETECTKPPGLGQDTGYWVDPPADMSAASSLMSGGVPSDFPKASRWISRDDYKNLFSDDFRRTPTDPEVLLVAGGIHRDGRVDWAPLYRLPEGFLDNAHPGDYSLRLLDATGGIVYQLPFSVSFRLTSHPPVEVDAAPFMFAVPYPEGTSVVELRLRNQLLSQVRVPTKLLSDAIATIPDTGYIGSAAQRRQTLQTDIAALDTRLAAGDPTGARDLLMALRRHADDSLVRDFATGYPLDYTKAALLELVGQQLERMNPTQARSIIDLSSGTAAARVGATVALTATVKDAGGSPRRGVPVTFAVQSGPDRDATGTGTTDSNGQATFQLTGSAAGTDIIQATFVDAGVIRSSNRVEVVFTPEPRPVSNPAPTPTVPSPTPTSVQASTLVLAPDPAARPPTPVRLAQTGRSALGEPALGIALGVLGAMLLAAGGLLGRRRRRPLRR